MKCKLCHKEFDGRKDAKFCSTKCRVSYSRGVRQGPQDKVEEVKPKTIETKVNSIANEKIAKAILALIENREKLLKGLEPHVVFFLGNTIIKIGLKEVIIGDTKFKLK